MSKSKINLGIIGIKPTESWAATRFDDAVGVQRTVDAIEKSSATGARVTLSPQNSPLPIL